MFVRARIPCFEEVGENCRVLALAKCWPRRLVLTLESQFFFLLPFLTLGGFRRLVILAPRLSSAAFDPVIGVGGLPPVDLLLIHLTQVLTHAGILHQ